MLCGLGRGIPDYLYHYPFSLLVIAKAFIIACTLIGLLIWHQLRSLAATPLFYYYTCSAVADLVALLLITISLWFMAQKFFWLRVDAVLLGFASLFTAMALLCAWEMLLLLQVESMRKREIIYMLAFFDFVFLQGFHLYILAAELFNLTFALYRARNQVSNLFIPGWGEEVTYSELEALELEY